MGEGEAATRQPSVAVIGAGMTGLTAASRIQESGYRVVVLEKDRRPGGRLASCRLNSATVDHGAQFITARSAEFIRTMKDLSVKGVAGKWFEGSTGKGHIRWKGVPCMNSIPNALAGKLDVRFGVDVTALRWESRLWIISGENGSTFTVNGVVMTPPVPQSLKIFDAGGGSLQEDIREELESISYHRCIAVIAVLTGPSVVGTPGGVAPSNGPISWIADNYVKGVSSVPALTIHATPKYSYEHWDEDAQQAGRKLVDAAEKWIRSEVAQVRVCRWRYSRPAHSHSSRSLMVQPPLVFAGDGFGGPRVEGAFLSGVSAAESIMGALGKRPSV